MPAGESAVRPPSPSYHNWAAVALAAETAIVPDFPLVNKSFELRYPCTDR